MQGKGKRGKKMKQLTIMGLLVALLCVTPMPAFASDEENERRHREVCTG